MTPSKRVLGAHAIYFALHGSLQVWNPDVSDGPGADYSLCYVPAYVAHCIASSHRLAGVVLIEPETVHGEALDAALRPQCWASGSRDSLALLARFKEALSVLREVPPAAGEGDRSFDRLLFGKPLCQSRMDVRVASALASMSELAGGTDAASLASQAHLSFGRFLHLFKYELGAPFRIARRWKRTRSWLAQLNVPGKLSSAALEANFADAAHFSRSVHAVLGLPPRDIVSGARGLRLFREVPACSAHGETPPSPSP